MIQRELLYANDRRGMTRLSVGTEVEVIAYEKLSDIDKAFFRSILKTERRTDFYARIFAFSYDGCVRMARIGLDGVPKERNR